ncbi:MAG: hypothetical protein SFW62_03075 [Alphaproteobacteria bacterium]|nr:hypothetical protein [Alphaproteobacteria bacterium]
MRHLFLILLAGIIGLGIWMHERSLPLPEHHLQIAERQAMATAPGRRMEHIVLRSARLGEIGFTINLPDPLPPGKLPIILVMGGLGSGAENTSYITRMGNNAVIGYDWPMPIWLPDGPDLLAAAPGLYRQVMTTPAQAASAVDWAVSQPWADRNRISILGYSLGALAAPAVQDSVQKAGHVVGWTIIAYGGAPLGKILSIEKNVTSPWRRRALELAIDIVLHPLEPTLHLPKLAGSFLILEGKDDTLMPPDARALLRDSVPQPKTVITFDGTHMGVGQSKAVLLEKIIAASGQWLVASGAVNPL